MKTLKKIQAVVVSLNSQLILIVKFDAGAVYVQCCTRAACEFIYRDGFSRNAFNFKKLLSNGHQRVKGKETARNPPGGGLLKQNSIFFNLN